MKEAYWTKTVINGVKGISSLIALPNFDLVKGILIDLMHALCLGAIKQHTTLLLTEKKTIFYWKFEANKAY